MVQAGAGPGEGARTVGAGSGGGGGTDRRGRGLRGRGPAWVGPDDGGRDLVARPDRTKKGGGAPGGWWLWEGWVTSLLPNSCLISSVPKQPYPPDPGDSLAVGGQEGPSDGERGAGG